LLQLAHSSHLPLQQVLQSWSLQQVGQDLPAACSDPVTAAKANAIAVISDFIFSFLKNRNEE
jgi:hypothetical protein